MASAHPITDHDEIREWAEERGANPACVKGTGAKNDTGMIRLDFPGYSGSDSLQSISWDDWFRQFDENNLALLVQDTTSRGQQSNFNKLVKRRTASARGARAARTRSTARSARSTSRQRSSTSSRSTSSRSTSGRNRKAASGSRTSSGGNTSQRSSGKTASGRGRKGTRQSRSRQR